MTKNRYCIFFLALAFSIVIADAPAQQRDCKFLNEACDDPVPQPGPSTTRPQKSDAEHLERCLADYVRRNGSFLPEGRSTASLKSRSDRCCRKRLEINGEQ
jgi:hypothetical protein